MKNARRRIDSHQHAFWHYRDDAGLVQDMDNYEIEYSWLLTWETHPTEHVTGTGYNQCLNPTRVRADGSLEGIMLEDLLLARRNYPDRFVMGFCPHPLTGNAPDRLRAAAGMYDVKVCGEWKFRIPFDDPRCIELYRTAGELGMPVVLHLDVPYLASNDGSSKYQPLWYGGTVDNLERALIACPDTIFIGHAPGFWRELSGDADTCPYTSPSTPIKEGGRLQRLFDKYENLWADLSAGSACNALKRDPDYAKNFLETYSSRLLFARDYYGSGLVNFLDSLDLSDEATQRIAWQNAERLVSPPSCDERAKKQAAIIQF